jgi:hypothetical protein
MTSQTSESRYVLEPVPLTNTQIDQILTRIPVPPGIGKSALALARKHLVDRVRTLLKAIKLVPVEAAFQELSDEIIKSLYESYVAPGTSVGITAGVSLGGPVTQLSLNSFHFAGAQSGVALAFQKVRDFLVGSKMNRAPQMKVYFKVPYTGSDLHEMQHAGTFESIMASRHEFEQTLVKDVIADNRILNREEAELAGIPQMLAYHSRIRPERFENAESKFRLTHVIELQLNTYRMFTHKITMAMLARAIEGPQMSGMPPDALTCVWRSQIDGKMYIIVEEAIKDMAVLMFLTRYVMRQYGQWKITGITGIISIEPQEVIVSRGIYRVEAIDGNHHVYTNNRKTRWDGISLADIHNLLISAGFNVTGINKQKLYLVVQGFEGDLESELTRRINAAEEEVNRSPQQQRLVSASSFHYALTNGTNMEEIVWRDDIDLFRTASNHSHEILGMLGIDAARIFLIYRFMQTLQDFSSYINPRHISLIFDLLCNLGIINSLSFVGINRRKIGPLAMASYERSFDVFVNASIYGDKETITGVSPSIFTGQRPKLGGTSSVVLEEDLSAIPRDRPTLPSADEDGNWEDLPEDFNILEGTELAGIMEDQDIRQTRTMTSAVSKPQAPVTKIISQPPQTLAANSIIPSGATVMMASPALLSALQKVSTGTGLTATARDLPQRTNQLDAIADVNQDSASVDIRRARPEIVATNLVPVSIDFLPYLSTINLQILEQRPVQDVSIANFSNQLSMLQQQQRLNGL